MSHRLLLGLEFDGEYDPRVKAELEQLVAALQTWQAKTPANDAEYLVASASDDLTAERVGVNSPTIRVDYSTPAQVRWHANASAFGAGYMMGNVGGEDGADGSPGRDGSGSGSAGPTGATGPQGQIGIPGQDGEDAFEWAIPGQPGAAGAAGATGSTGPAGTGGVPIEVTVNTTISTQTGWVVPESLEIDPGVSLEIAGGARLEITGAVAIHGFELDYAEFTAAVTVTNTTEGTADTILTGHAVTYDGTTTVLVEFFSPFVSSGTTAGSSILLWLYQDGTSIGNLGQVQNDAAAQLRDPVHLIRRMTPTAGSHTYGIRASRSVSSGFVNAGPGGNGQQMPGYIRITVV